MYAALGFVRLRTAIVMKDECSNYGLYYVMESTSEVTYSANRGFSICRTAKLHSTTLQSTILVLYNETTRLAEHAQP